MEQMNKEIIEAHERLVTSSFDKAQAYSQVIFSIGYVGIFAASGFTKEYLTREEILWSALLACISIVFFVLFEVFKMFISSRTILQLRNAIRNPELFQQKLKQYEDRNKIWEFRYTIAWYVCWPISASTGIGAAAILMWAFVVHLLEGKQ